MPVGAGFLSAFLDQILVQVYDYLGTDVVHSHDAEVSELGGANLKKKEIAVGWLFGHDKIKVAFDLKSGHGGVPVYARLYVNDVEKGTPQSESGISYVTKTETLSGIVDLDKIGLYLRGMPASNLIAGYGDPGDPEAITVYSGIMDETLEVWENLVPGWWLIGLTFDGTNIISAFKNYTDVKILFHDGISSTILSSYEAFSNKANALTVAGGDLIETDSFYETIKVHVGLDRVLRTQFNAPADKCRGLAFDGANLISSDKGTNLIYVHNGVAQAISRSFAAPSGDIVGLAFDGVNLLSLDVWAGKIYVHDGVTSSILRSYDFGTAGVTEYGGLTTYGYAGGAAAAYAKNFRIIGKSGTMAEKSMVFENIL